MVTAYRAHGLRVVIFTDDHEPAHVHVFGDGEAKINLAGAEGAPELLGCRHDRADLRRAMQIVKEQAMLLERWRNSWLISPTPKLMPPWSGARSPWKPNHGRRRRYDRQLDRVIVDLTNGCTFAFPPRIAQGLETATADQLAEVEILGGIWAALGRSGC
jgi:hypothetical protein